MINHSVIVLALLIFGAINVTKAKSVTHKKLTPEQKTEMRQRMLKKTGGLMVVPGKGKLMIINSQNDYDHTNVVSNIPLFRKVLRINIQCDRGSFSISDAKKELKKHNASAAVFIIDDDNLPVSMIAPEEMWGFINTAKLKKETTDQQSYHSRIRKSLSRAITYVLGGASSRSKSSVMQTISSINQLDLIKNEIPSSDVLINIYQNLNKIGITQNKLTTYLKACEEGWAPAPTNEFQKAIWDKVHTMPTAPLKIKPETKKVVQ